MKRFFFSNILDYSEEEQRRDAEYMAIMGVGQGLGRTEEVLLASGCLSEVADHIREDFGGKARVWYLADENTLSAVRPYFDPENSAASVQIHVLPAEPRPLPILEDIEKLEIDAGAYSPDLVIALGGGVISDMVKKISADTGIPNWAIPTAPSVDAYTSGTAALRVNKYHQSLPINPAHKVFCDLKVLTEAPRVLFLSGVGDLLGKLLALLDWNISHIITAEPIIKEYSEASADSARRAIDACRNIQDGPETAVESLTDALLTSGLIMQRIMGSRPASSSEHIVAHFWEMTFGVKNPDLDLHGILVSVASKMVYKAYMDILEKMERLDLDIDKRLEDFERESPDYKRLHPELIPFLDVIGKEMESRRINREILSKRLNNFVDKRESILGLCRDILGEIKEKIEILESLDFPFSPDDIKLDMKVAYASFHSARYLRDRYTLFDLAYELGISPNYLQVLFDKGE